MNQGIGCLDVTREVGCVAVRTGELGVRELDDAARSVGRAGGHVPRVYMPVRVGSHIVGHRQEGVVLLTPVAHRRTNDFGSAVTRGFDTCTVP